MPKAAVAPSSAPPERKTRGRSRAPVEDEADPLDTIGDADVELVAIVPAPKGRRARSVKPVKEEEAELVLEAPVPVPAPARAGRAKKAAAPPAVPAAPKPRATRKGAAPASAPAAVEVGEKENAPGEEREEVEGPAVKVRVSRSRKVKEEAVEPEAGATVPRRATRTRTRT
ncbi:hypothetical protein FB451DRAFT_1226124 [Mycena latifolia]|nr:hypothetical protein FB451DRAFT_1226124 [Mycena latifolia]